MSKMAGPIGDKLGMVIRGLNAAAIIAIVIITGLLFGGETLKTYEFSYDDMTNAHHAGGRNILDYVKLELTFSGVDVSYGPLGKDLSAWHQNGMPDGESAYADDCDKSEFEDWPAKVTEEDGYIVKKAEACSNYTENMCPLVMGCQWIDPTAPAGGGTPTCIPMNYEFSCKISATPNLTTGYVSDVQTCIGNLYQQARSYKCALNCSNPPCVNATNSFAPAADATCVMAKLETADDSESMCSERKSYRVLLFTFALIWILFALLAIALQMLFKIQNVYVMAGVNLVALTSHVVFIAISIAMTETFMNEDTGTSETFAAIHEGHKPVAGGNPPTDLHVTTSNESGLAMLQALPYVALLSGMLTMLQIVRLHESDNWKMEPLYAKMMTFV